MNVGLDELDARAEAVAAELAGSDASSASSGEESSDSDVGLASFAAVRPAKRQKRSSSLPLLESHPGAADEDSEDSADEDFDPKGELRLEDLEDAHEFLVRDHIDTFNGMLSRWAATDLLEEGDDIDLSTGRIVHNRGHLRAFQPNRGQNLAAVFDSEDEDGLSEDEDGSGEGVDEVAVAEAKRDGVPVMRAELDDGFVELGMESLYLVCESRAPLLDQVVRMSAPRWIL